MGTDDLRWSKFWWQDWRSDTALRVCSLSARGLWIEMLALMHEAKPRGHLLVNEKAPDARRLAALVGSTEREVKAGLEILEAEGVFSRTPEGVIYSRRMVKETKEREAGREFGRKGGNPALKAKPADPKVNGGDGGLTPPVKPTPTPPFIIQEAEAEAEEERSPPASRVPRQTEPRGSRLPDDWKPSEEDAAFARSLGLDPRRVADEFRDYWHGVAGQKGRKLDWSGTFRNRCRDRAERAPAAALRMRPATPAELLADLPNRYPDDAPPEPLFVFSERLN